MAIKIYVISYTELFMNEFKCENKVAFSRIEAQRIFDGYVHKIADYNHPDFKDEVLSNLGKSQMDWTIFGVDAKYHVSIDEHKANLNI